jgi:single-stranded-DNA-specific exonuclease
VKRLLRARRIIDALTVSELFQPKLSSLKEPLSIKGMQEARDRLLAAYSTKEKVCIYADFDLDGTSGLALLYEGLRDLGFQALQYYQPKRLAEGYGFHAHAVDELHRQGVKLIVTVDVGITANETVAHARSIGMDVIITDHHMPANELPPANVIVNPNQPGCESGLGYLCGAGVGFYLLRAVSSSLVEQNLILRDQVDLKKYLDFFTIGTLTDLVPLVGDNRILVKHGLKQIENTERAGLKALAESLNLRGRPLTSSDVAIRFAPKLNALSRMENGILPVDIFLVSDEVKAHDMMKAVLTNNETRVTEQHSGEKRASDLLANWTNKEFVFVTSTEFHRGVIGLIATKLAQSHNCPAFVGSQNKDGIIVGSSRVPFAGESSVLQALESASEKLNRFGGHHQAAGFELHESNIQNFLEGLTSFYTKKDIERPPIRFEYDFEIALDECQASLLKWLDVIGPFGQGFPAPQFILKNMQIKSIYELKGGHLKFRFNSTQGNSAPEALFFSPPPYLKRPSVDDYIDVLGELQWNFFAGSQKLQFLIRDLKQSKTQEGEASL